MVSSVVAEAAGMVASMATGKTAARRGQKSRWREHRRNFACRFCLPQKQQGAKTQQNYEDAAF
jgi:hypothetical protein